MGFPPGKTLGPCGMRSDHREPGVFGLCRGAFGTDKFIELQKNNSNCILGYGICRKFCVL